MWQCSSSFHRTSSCCIAISLFTTQLANHLSDATSDALPQSLSLLRHKPAVVAHAHLDDPPEASTAARWRNRFSSEYHLRSHSG